MLASARFANYPDRKESRGVESSMVVHTWSLLRSDWQPSNCLKGKVSIEPWIVAICRAAASQTGADVPRLMLTSRASRTLRAGMPSDIW